MLRKRPLTTCIALAWYLTLSVAGALFHDHGPYQDGPCCDHRPLPIEVHHAPDHCCSHRPQATAPDGERQPAAPHDECPACELLSLQPLCASVVTAPQVESVLSGVFCQEITEVESERCLPPQSRGPPRV